MTERAVGPQVDAAPAGLPAPVTLTGRYGAVVRLDAARQRSDLWAAMRDHDEMWTYMSYGPLPDANAFTAWLAEREALKDPYYYCIVDSTNRALGVFALMEIRTAMRSVEVGHVLYSPALQRTPLGTEAQYLLARYAFETLGYRRYEWKCNSLNNPSRRAALRYGFVFEGVLRQHMIVKGRNRDTAYFSMLDDEWPARKLAFERWLAPDNFDAAGRQKMRLEQCISS